MPPAAWDCDVMAIKKVLTSAKVRQREISIKAP
jgi:hypothetical protein